MQNIKVVIPALLLSVFLCSCLKNDDTKNCNYEPCVNKAPANEVDSVTAYLAKKGITDATKYCSGLYYKITAPGTDKTPNICSYVTVGYKGMLTDGTVFTRDTSGLILSSLIEGWKQGLLLIKKGGKVTLYVPPSLGYGAQGRQPAIPPNAVLIFDIELLDVE